ncbi:phage shock protein PspA [Thiolapillus brandeum]|uniref:Phage shock protein A n=1 Tax=Thiolapillus brandeum TaxID=1076588 RepID=A0A7U6JH27_9GAMM|nr:phage shock protein PspA [Thiolapillus brandeum]BAO43941.1 phage shock protein A [Thiolapillus brandeum]
MGIFSRLHDIINSNITAMLDKAENPEKIIRLVIQEMEDTLVEVRSDAARTIAEKKKLQRRMDQMQHEIREWQRKAELALSKEREDLARAALKEKHSLENAVASMDKELEILESQLLQLNQDTGKLQKKLDDAKARHKTMMMKHNTVSGRLRTREKLHDSRIDDALSRFETVEQKMEHMEGKVEAYDIGRDPSLHDQFAELEAEDIIEDELSKLKSRLSEDKQ